MRIHEPACSPQQALRLEALLQQRLPKSRCYRDISLAPFSCFATGGNAQLLLLPHSKEELLEILELCEQVETPLTLLGGGANALVADAGTNGPVLCLRYLRQAASWREQLLEAEAGWEMSALCRYSAEQDAAGLHFFFGMPGSIGGAVYMNARCYGGEISQIVHSVLCIPRSLSPSRREFEAAGGNGGRPLKAAHFSPGQLCWVELGPDDWCYKYSHFQQDSGHRLAGALIVAVRLALREQPRASLQQEMGSFLEDRIAKGHFRLPCGGSFFKNKRSFGAPSGQIIDQLGLKGKRWGGAQLAPWHGNIIVNARCATATEIWHLATIIQEQVARQRGFFLEPEVQRLGIWDF